mmetsp:Transcript_6507/g.10944  ORF Transcript_6507/g.10944 Transcript_6507/m.10944 type:complete len:81 (+) Transcript_6507:383-625(+)
MGIKDQQKWLKRNIERRELPLEAQHLGGDAVHLGLKAVRRGAVVRRGARKWQQSNRYRVLEVLTNNNNNRIGRPKDAPII